ncbi:MAG: aromatic ring-hydroxylating dioxygenase subunit alpha, partial [Alphaproteobacteria bacterium]|nr:aromatic ring-hydroxylating dioxygenase subunit alpha [Alphaproteobacteria bacterium]
MTETWVRNCWYVAAPAHEIGRELLARTFLNTPVVLFRREDGTAVALEDRCSHRFLPLSKGFLVGDRVQCGYHGMEFGCDGACEHVPGQKSRPPGADIKSFPIAEKWQFVWIWMGDAELADEDLIPDIPRNDHPDWTPIVGDTLYIRGDYRLFLDNLMDPSHVSFVHRTTLGTDDVAEIPQIASQDGDVVKVTRWILDRPVAPVYAKVSKLTRFGEFKDNVDRW